MTDSDTFSQRVGSINDQHRAEGSGQRGVVRGERSGGSGRGGGGSEGSGQRIRSGVKDSV